MDMVRFSLVDFEPNVYVHSLLTRKFSDQQKGAAKYESSLQDQLQFMRNYSPMSKYTPMEFVCDERIYDTLTSFEWKFINPGIVVVNDVEFAKKILVKFRTWFMFPFNVKNEELIYKMIENNFSRFQKLVYTLRDEVELMEKLSREFVDNFENMNESEQCEILSSTYGAMVLEKYDSLEEERLRDIILNDEAFMELFGSLITEKQYHKVDLSRASYSLRGNEEFMKPFIEFDGMNLRFASGKLRNEWSFVKIALSNNVNAFQFATVNLRSISAYDAVKISTDALQYIASNMRNNMYFYTRLLQENIKFDIPSKDFIIRLVKHKPKNYLLIPIDSEYRLDRDVMLLAPDESIEEALKLYSADRIFIREMMSNMKNASKYFDENCGNDFKMIKGCMKLNPHLIRYASKEIRSNLEQVMLLIDYCITPGALFHLIIHSSYDNRKDKNFALKCVEKFGISLRYLRNFWNDKEVVMKAVEQDFQSFSFASDCLKLDCDLIKASPRCIFLINDLPKHPIFADHEFLVECITKHNLFLYSRPIPQEIMKTCLFKNPAAYLMYNQYVNIDEETCLKILEKKENFQLFSNLSYISHYFHKRRIGFSFTEKACKVNPLINLELDQNWKNSIDYTSMYYTEGGEKFIDKFNERMREVYHSAYIPIHKKMKILP